MTLDTLDNILFTLVMLIIVLYGLQFHKLMGLLEKRQPALYESIGKPKVWTIPTKRTPKGKYTPFGIVRNIPESFPKDELLRNEANKNLNLCRAAYIALGIYLTFVLWRILLLFS